MAKDLMHMHSHLMLCLPFSGHRLTSSSVRLPSLAHSLPPWAPQTSSSLVLISPELIEFSFFVRKLTRGLCEEREESDRRMRETERDHITPALPLWLPVRHRIDLKVSLTLKSLNGLAPPHSAELHIHAPVRSSQLLLDLKQDS